MIRELHVDRPSPELSHATAEVADHGRGRDLVAHFQEGLVFSLEHQDVGDASEGDTQMDDFRFRDVVRNVTDVNDPRGFSHVSVQFHLQISARLGCNLFRGDVMFGGFSGKRYS